jgi:hypothetical protein
MSPASTSAPAAPALSAMSMTILASPFSYQTSPASTTSGLSSPATVRVVTATPLAAALSVIAASANGSVSTAVTAAAPALAAAMATSPEPAPKSVTCRLATRPGLSSR